MSTDLSNALIERMQAALEARQALRIVGGDSKPLLGRGVDGEAFEVGGHRGVVDYQPKELVITARCGTRLDELDETLAEAGQMLPFEPPRLGPGATIGGTLACGLSGPARPYLGAARDLVLGTRVLTGRAQLLRFGGEVMKNVAGYDVSRLMSGAYGTLGVVLEVSLKVLPRPERVETRVLDLSAGSAVEAMSRWAGKPLPITATCHDGESLFVRLGGGVQGVRAAAGIIGGELLRSERADAFWRDEIREQGHAFFAGDEPLWRLSVPPHAPVDDAHGRQLIEWGGAQRWLRGRQDAEAVRATARSLGGHATLFRGGERAGEVFQRPSDGHMTLQRRIKQAFDPAGLLNPGRLYADL